MIPGFSRNCRRTSSTTALPAWPTAAMQKEANRNGIAPPISRPTTTYGSPRSNEIVDVLALLLQLEEELVAVGGEEHDRGEAGRRDRVALGDGLGRVADRVERVGDLVAHLLGQAGHLRDAAGVVRDRAEGVERDDHAGHREHGDDRDGDAGQAGELVRDDDAGADDDHRGRRGLHRVARGPR